MNILVPVLIWAACVVIALAVAATCQWLGGDR